jgi:hypothetical protein
MKFKKGLIIVILMCFSLLVYSNEFGMNKPLGLNSIQKYGTKGSTRLGISTGVNLYVGYQMDYQLTRNFGEINELKLGYGLGVYRTMNNNWESGLTLKQGSFSSLKSNNTQGIMGKFNEIQFNLQKSLNENILLDVASLTFNVQFGLGAIQYQSQYFYLDPKKQSITQIASSVGYGYTGQGEFRAQKFYNIPDKKIAIVGNIGFNIGYRLSGNMMLYFENIYSQSTSTKLSVNLIMDTKVPPDGIFYSGLSLYVNLGKKVGSFGRNSCPRWF